jgi:hypothetical protein
MQASPATCARALASSLLLIIINQFINQNISQSSAIPSFQGRPEKGNSMGNGVIPKIIIFAASQSKIDA